MGGHFKRTIFILFIIIVIVGLMVMTFFIMGKKRNNPLPVMGGTIHEITNESYIKEVVNENITQGDNERFRRPSKQLPLTNEFSFEQFQDDNINPPIITTNFESSEDVIKAYFGILEDASNMGGYVGGCGTIGNSLQPYPYAYGLYSKASQKKMPLFEFIDSFKGIGHITLLKLYPAYIPPETPANIQYYIFEIEAIAGASEKDKNQHKRDGSYFTYYNGLITVEHDSNNGWKFKDIDYLPENFLCAPDHGWVYSAEYLVPIVYQDWYHLINQIDSIEQNGSIVSVYASGGDKKYKFDFIRLTNGYDILIHESILDNNKWQEINILKDEDQRLKLSPLNPNLG